jgi:hypothetical protein
MTQSIKAAQIKKIKTLQRVAGMEKDDYLEMLWNLAKVKSCTELKGLQIDVVIRHLEGCAGQGGSGRRTHGYPQEIRRRWGRASRVAREWGADSQQARWALGKWPFAQFRVGQPEELTVAQGQAAIEALKAMEHRSKRWTAK